MLTAHAAKTVFPASHSTKRHVETTSDATRGTDLAPADLKAPPRHPPAISGSRMSGSHVAPNKANRNKTDRRRFHAAPVCDSVFRA